MIIRPNPPVTASVGVITVTQWRMAASTTTLKIVGCRGSLWFTPWYLSNGLPNYPMALATMVSLSQYVQRSQSVLGPTPYSATSLRGLSWSKASQVFWISVNTLKRTNFLMIVICWSRLDSRAAFLFPQTNRNPWISSWYVITVVSRHLRRRATALHWTSTSPISRKSLFPFGINTTVCHVHSLASSPSRNASRTMAKPFWQLVVSGESSCVAAISH